MTTPLNVTADGLRIFADRAEQQAALVAGVITPPSPDPAFEAISAATNAVWVRAANTARAMQARLTMTSEAARFAATAYETADGDGAGRIDGVR